MRRQRVVRASSAQSLCIFCACRFGLEPGIAQISRRKLTTTHPSTQSASTVVESGSATPSPGPASISASTSASSFTFDPNSSLTASEQQEKWRRTSLQRKIQEERARIEAERARIEAERARIEAERARIEAEQQQQAKKQAADKAAKAKLERERRSNMGKVEAERRKQLNASNGRNSWRFGFGSAAAASAPAGQSLGQAMTSSTPQQGDRSSVKFAQSDGNWRASNRDQTKSGRREPPKGLKIVKFSARAKENVVASRPRQDKGSHPAVRRPDLQSARKSPESQPKQPKRVAMPDFMLPKQPQRVAMPDFMLPKQSAAPAAALTTGWGARPTDVKPREYGDAPPKIEDVDNMESNMQDFRDLPYAYSPDTQDGPTAVDDRELPFEQDQRLLDLPSRIEEPEPALPEVDHGTTEGTETVARLQEESQSHASTLDSFGYFEDDVSEVKPEEPSSTPPQDSIYLPNTKSKGVAEAEMQAATFRGVEQSIAEGSPVSAPDQISQSSASPGSSFPSFSAPPAEPKPTSEQPLGTARFSVEHVPNASASSSPAAVATPGAEQIVESPRVPDGRPPASQLSPQQEMIEKMRRMVEDFDRMNNPKPDASSSLKPVHGTEKPAPVRSQDTATSQGWGRSASPPASDPTKAFKLVQQSRSTNSGNAALQNLNGSTWQHRLGDTGYRATPFDPHELLQPSQSPVEDGRKWGLLRRQQGPELSPLPPPTPQPAALPQWKASRVREEDADKLFEVHRATRPSFAPPAPAQHESYSVGRTYSDRDLSNKKCGRCGQIGHVAGMCPGTLPPSPRGDRPVFKVYVGRVSPAASGADFFKYFIKFEGVVSARLIMHYSDVPVDTPRSKGFGFVSFDTEQARERFMTKKPFILLGQQMVTHLYIDQGPSREGTIQKSSTTAAGRSSQDQVKNPFVAAGNTNGGEVVRRTSSENRFNQVASINAPLPPATRQGKENDHDEGNPHGRQAQSSSSPVEEPRRSGRDARRRLWEEPEADVEKLDRGAERKGRRGSRREMDEDEEDERGGAREAHRARKAARQRQKDAEKDAEKQAAKQKRELKKKEAGTPITLPEFISVQHLSQALGVRYEAFVERLEDLGYDDIFAGKTLDSETSGMIAMEYNFDPTFDGGYREEEVRDLKARPPLVDRASLPTRPPVVTIMGHVDHGKTTILDYLRKSSVAAGEAGGITQHIGAFSVPLTASGKTVTFLDTPGHAAFLAMRQRGANVTDMVILVVAADDSVKPQTLEAIRHAKEAGVPMIVALNKVDKPEADVERCKQDLARHGVEIEDYGGDVQIVEVSGKTGKGMDALEENVVALSELLDHRAETDGAVEGWILEATTRKAGRVATVLVRRGTLVPGAIIVAGKTWARVRSLKNEAGVELKEGAPGMPCEVDGWRDQPHAGDEVLEAPTEQKAGSVVDFRIELAEREQTKRDMEIINTNRRLEQEKREREKAAEKAAKRAVAAAAAAAVGPDGTLIPADTPDTFTAPSEKPETEQESGQLTVPFVIKADVSGSAEAVAAYILSLSSPLIAPTILASGVGPVHESDIELASAASGHIIAFNLPNNPDAMGNATARGVKILANDIIYRCLDDVKAVLEDKLPPIVTSRVMGEADISEKFEIGVGGRKKIAIAGVKVRNGSVTRNARVRVMRGGEKIYDGTISSLKNQKKDADVMRKGSECGMGFADWESFESGDQVQVYEEISEKRRL